MTRQVSRAAEAYRATSEHRNYRAQEADMFLRINGALRVFRNENTASRARALADNRRLWTAVIASVQDPDNMLPVDLRATIVSLGLYVQRESDAENPDIDFLIAVNENIATGLSGEP